MNINAITAINKVQNRYTSKKISTNSTKSIPSLGTSISFGAILENIIEEDLSAISSAVKLELSQDALDYLENGTIPNKKQNIIGYTKNGQIIYE